MIIAGPALRAVVTAMLQYSTEYRGRIMTADYPTLGLLKNDRLEPSTTLPDVALFETTATPFQALFWRLESTRVLHEVL